jgi:taurine dioxygenase
MMKVRRISPSLGAEVTGFDVNAIGAAASLEEVKRHLFEHQLLVFRDQRLDAQDIERFTRRFGEPDPHVLTQFALAGHPDIFVISNIVRDGKPLGSRSEGFGWHTDLIYFAQPASYTILYALEVPEEGGDTLFASLYRAYDELSEAERKRLRALRARHSYTHMYDKRPGAEPLPPEQRARTPDVVHPMVRRHPETAREGLYINRETVAGIDGLSADESRTLIGRLFDFALQDRFRYAHKWRAGDLVIWDNRGLLHCATPYDMEKHRRLLYRMSVRGEVPIAANQQPLAPDSSFQETAVASRSR